MKILHFADAHIDTASGSGRHDPATGLPVRVMDFLRSLDEIVDTAISEKVDLVIFAGDAYKDRMPTPTYQREWGRRIMRLSEARIPTLLLVGNHDTSPASGRANTLDVFNTLAVPFVRVSAKPEFLKPADLWGVPVQIITVPWVHASNLIAKGIEVDSSSMGTEIEMRVTNAVSGWLDQLDPALPTILTAHCSVQGASFSSERQVMLGKDMVMPGWLVKDPRLDYVALGHIHKYQNLNDGQHPPVIYPGSIERVDFGEVNDQKTFIVAEIQKGTTSFEIHELNTRLFVEVNFSIDKKGKVFMGENEIAGDGIGKVTETIIAAIQCHHQSNDAMLRVILTYPKDIEDFIDEKKLSQAFTSAFEYHLIRKPQYEQRLRLEVDAAALIGMNPMELLQLYFASIGQPEALKDEGLKGLAQDIMSSVDQEQELKFLPKDQLAQMQIEATEKVLA